MIIRQWFHLTGVINTIAYDDGLKSTEAEKKRLLSIWLVTTAMLDNQIQGYHERAKVFDIPDRLIDLEPDTYDEDESKPGARINEIEVGLEIPVGETFKVAVKSAGVKSDIWGTYNYELM